MITFTTQAVPATCSICSSSGILSLGAKDFGHSGNDHFAGSRQFPDYGVAIAYYGCTQCGVVFTNAFDDWTAGDFKAHVYNSQYSLADPPFEHERPERNAQMVTGLWHTDKSRLRLLDFGGGSGTMARRLLELGFDCDTCDSFYGDAAHASRYEVVTCFEVIEHVPHSAQHHCLETIASHLTVDGMVLLSTTVFEPGASLDHWYVCPRNGHITIHSAKSLALLAEKNGFEVFSINREMHLLRRLGNSAESAKPESAEPVTRSAAPSPAMTV